MTGYPGSNGISPSQKRENLPFTIRLLNHKDKHGNDQHDQQLLPLLPASYRTKEGDVVAAGHNNTLACAKEELDLERLVSIHRWLWLVGRPMPPRPLHHQLVLDREIVLTEKMDMHLVWTAGRIFLKPIPRFLLEPGFWSQYLSCGRACGCAGDRTSPVDGSTASCNRELHKRALGFLFSYAALISHESDFGIAKERNLLPQEISWPNWRTFVQELGPDNIYPRVDPRFHYGELRLSRLNKIYRLKENLLRGYASRWKRYHDFWHENLTLLAGSTVYMAIVLTAMQVGLATTRLGDNGAFQAASYGFTVFSIIGPLIAVILITLGFCVIFVYSWVVTVRYGKQRLARIWGQADTLT